MKIRGKQTQFGQLSLVVGLLVSILFSPAVHASAGDTAAYWKFDEATTGAIAVDASGNGNDAQPNTFGSQLPTPSTDVPSNILFHDPYSAEFNGDNYYLVNRPVQDDFTICAWIKTTSVGNGPNHWETAPIMDSEVGGVTNDFGFGIADSGKLAFGDGDNFGNDIRVDGNTVVNDNIWHDVCASRSSSDGTIILYVDAQVDGTGTGTLGTLNANPEARIGYGFDGAALYQGNIDDARTYNRVLSPTEIANLTAGSNDPSVAGDDGTIHTTAATPNPSNPATAVESTLTDTGTDTLLTSALAMALLVTAVYVRSFNRRRAS